MAQSAGTQVAQNKLAVSGAEVILLVLLVMLGMGLCVWVERAFTWIYDEPNEQQFLKARGINEKQEEVTRQEGLIKEAEKQLDAAELDRLKQTATITSLEKLYSGIGKPGSTSVSPEAQKSYEAVKTQQLGTEELTRLLNARITILKTQATEAAKQLEPEKQAATKDLQRAKMKYLLAKSVVSFFLPLIIVLVVLFVAGRFLNHVARRQVWTSQGWLPFVVVVCALLVLLAYQAFEVGGAVLIGMILFLILLWKINWSTQASNKRTE